MTIEGNIGVKVKKTLDESNVAETEYRERGVCDKRGGIQKQSETENTKTQNILKKLTYDDV